MTPENDKELKNLFSTAFTEFDDNEEFIATLSGNLDKMGYAKRLFEAQEHRHKIGLLLAFIAGSVSVILIMLIFPLLPTDAKIIGSLIHGSVMVMSVSASFTCPELGLNTPEMNIHIYFGTCSGFIFEENAMH